MLRARGRITHGRIQEAANRHPSGGPRLQYHSRLEQSLQVGPLFCGGSEPPKDLSRKMNGKGSPAGKTQQNHAGPEDVDVFGGSGRFKKGFALRRLAPRSNRCQGGQLRFRKAIKKDRSFNSLVATMRAPAIPHEIFPVAAQIGRHNNCLSPGPQSVQGPMSRVAHGSHFKAPGLIRNCS